MTSPRTFADPLAALLCNAEVAAAAEEASDAARAACEHLRWHEGLRRRWPEARAEATVRCAWAAADLDGMPMPLADFRRDVLGGQQAGGGSGRVAAAAAAGAFAAQSMAELAMPALGAPAGRHPLPPAAQLFARLHVAAVGPVAALWQDRDPGLGRPRGTEQPEDLRGLGEAPTGAALAGRLRLLGDLVPMAADAGAAAGGGGAGRPGGAGRVPAVVLVAVVHGELLAARPFRTGNAVVAGAVGRVLATVSGLDPTGTLVPAVAWAAARNEHLSAAAHYATGTPAGVAVWLRHYGRSVVAGAEEAERIATAVLAGRLDGAG